ncbi:MAG TPA: serine hydrolase domain-containing protein [Pyrinomonadaceae bacterium]|nr:serine hydrolase domain-containing protein [Pyrinomonadaceae bacterium]
MTCASAQQAQTASATAEQRVREIIQLINSGDRQAARSYINQNYTASALKEESLEQRIGSISQLSDLTRGVELQSVKEPKPNSVRALVRSKLTGQWRELSIELEANPPHRIEGFDWVTRPTPADKQPDKKLSEKEIVRELEVFMQKLATADVFSGVVLLAKDGKIIFNKAYGEANKDFSIPNQLDTKFNLASLNKMFTSVAIAQLVEQGKLSYDDPLSKFMPEFPGREAAEKIKIKHLLTHTSGLGDYSVSASRQGVRTVDDFLKLAKEDKLAFEPGTDQAYSNTAFLVLGKVVEKVTGRSYYDYVRENIYERAGMRNTDAYDLDLVNKNLAVGYEKDYTDRGIVFRNNICMVGHGGPAGGGFSTAEDLWRFTGALRAGKLVGNNYAQAILSPKPELNSPTYGYGFNILNGIAGHSGGDTGVNTNLEMFLDDGYTSIILSNYGGAMRQVNIKIRELIQAGKSAPSATR